MTVVDVKKNAEQKMQKSIETLKADLAKFLTSNAGTSGRQTTTQQP